MVQAFIARESRRTCGREGGGGAAAGLLAHGVWRDCGLAGGGGSAACVGGAGGAGLARSAQTSRPHSAGRSRSEPAHSLPHLINFYSYLNENM